MVEFTLVAPILIIVFVAIADFGRIFAAGIVIDSAARDGAEIASQAYLGSPPGPLDQPAIGDAAYYDGIHALAAKRVCAEARSLPATDFNPTTAACDTWPIVRVCIHDGRDPNCGASIPSFPATIPASCTDASSPWTNSQSGGTERYVEVRVCYQFTSILSLPLISFGTFYIQRTRVFAIPCYFKLGTAACG